MNKAAFLKIINHVSAISEQEVSELEKLAASFPYCQTAHLLLAKAAYDHGSMLSNQRIRRAAACATNRQLFKKLIYTATPELELAPVILEPGLLPPIKSEDEFLNTAEQLRDKTDLTKQANLKAPTPNSEELPTITNELANVELTEAVPADRVEQVLGDVSSLPELTELEDNLPAHLDLNTSEKQAEDVEPIEVLEDQDTLFIIENLHPAAPYRDLVTDFVGNMIITEPEFLVEEGIDQTKQSEKELFENINSDNQTLELQGLAEKRLNLDVPSLEQDDTLAQFDQFLFKPEKDQDFDEEPAISIPFKEEILYKVFSQNELGYWMASSRLGETLQVKDELTPAKPYYFQPDLILEYSKQHELETYLPPAEPAHNPQIELIDQFLRQNPKLKSMANLKIKAEPLEDLSLKSSKIKKTIASETLANILIKQGKTKKAIKIYEHLILKIPEKKAYFASQIEKLQKLT